MERRAGRPGPHPGPRLQWGLPRGPTLGHIRARGTTAPQTFQNGCSQGSPTPPSRTNAPKGQRRGAREAAPAFPRAVATG
eukprot:2188163-Pyramimonas_sp.AAC.1